MKTIDNLTRQRVFAAYWYCDVLLTGYGDDQHETVAPLNELDMNFVGIDYGIGKREGIYHAKILVTPLSSITDEDAIGVSELCTPENDKNVANIKQWCHIYAMQSSSITDFLRSHGYATPCAGFTIDQLVEAGIFKIKTQEA